MVDREKVIKGLQEAVDWLSTETSLTVVDQWVVRDALALLKEQEQRHRLEVHNIGNVDIPDGVTEEQFHAVMNNVVAALEHTDRGESWPYDDKRR